MVRIPVAVRRPGAKRGTPGPRRRPARRLLAAAFALAGWGVLTLGVAPALAISPSCGATITASTTLRADLIDCRGDGLAVGADNITLNLNGHTIDGDAASSGGDDVGVRVAGRHGIVIRGGTVREFDHAVHLTAASHNAILKLVATGNGDVDNGTAIRLDDGSDYNRIERNDASDNGRAGVTMSDSSHNLVLANRTNGNGGLGMGVSGGSDNSVVANVIANNNNTGIAWDGTTGGRVAGNRISGHSFAGLAMESDGTTAVANVINDNGGNIILGGNGNVLRENVIRDARGCEGCGDGISAEHGTGNLVTRNLVIGNALDGIRLDSFDPENSPATGTVIRGNVVRRSGQDGISVGTETDNPIPNTRIAGNHVSRSADDGIDVARAGTLVAENTANLNGDLGISAVLGVIDGGGNHAFGNGNPAQCINIAC
jgi:parallel beta-helix repeat protein